MEKVLDNPNPHKNLTPPRSLGTPDEGGDVGLDGETNVTDDYPAGDNRFTGKIHKVVIELK